MVMCGKEDSSGSEMASYPGEELGKWDVSGQSKARNNQSLVAAGCPRHLSRCRR